MKRILIFCSFIFMLHLFAGAQVIDWGCDQKTALNATEKDEAWKQCLAKYEPAPQGFTLEIFVYPHPDKIDPCAMVVYAVLTPNCRKSEPKCGMPSRSVASANVNWEGKVTAMKCFE